MTALTIYQNIGAPDTQRVQRTLETNDLSAAGT
jgi:hypothetical protein